MPDTDTTVPKPQTRLCTTIWERRSTQLTTDQWAVIDKAAVDLSCLAVGGATAGRPSWRSMMRMIADGELVIQQPAKSKRG